MHNVEITDFQKAKEIAKKVQLGHAFAFLGEGVGPRDDAAARRRRLQIGPSPDGRRVVALVDDTVDLPGVRIVPRPWSVDRIAGLSTDRDLYRAEQDTVYFHAAFADPPESATLRLSCSGSHLLRRELEIIGSMAVEPVTMLSAGDYEACLEVDGREQGAAVSFTVAEFSLAPIAVRLVEHELERETGVLLFTLSVESYQQPLARPIEVSLVEKGYEIRTVVLEPERPGCYRGRLPGAGSSDAALRLRVTPTDDATKIAEVAVPGSRRAERETTCMSELGRERLFCLLPEPGAIPTHGGFLTDGEMFETPVVVEEILTATPGLIIKKAVECMVLVIHDLATDRTVVRDIGAREAGARVDVEAGAAAACVFVGAWIDGQPFEAFTTFLRPPEFEVTVDVLATPEPGGALRLALDTPGADRPVRTLLCIRDARLTQADRPAMVLGASLKRGVASAVGPMLGGGPHMLDEWVGLDDSTVLYCGDGLTGVDAGSLFIDSIDRPVAATALFDPGDLGSAGSVLCVEESIEESPPDLPEVRGDFPQVLFFAVLDVDARLELVIPLGSALTTYVIEAFSMFDGAWREARESVVVDQPLRVDLDLPPFVNEGVGARGILRADSLEDAAFVGLLRDGEPVPLTLPDGRPVAGNLPLVTPAELYFQAIPGDYCAEIREPGSGALDRVAQRVETLGRFRSLSRSIRLLEPGDAVDLESLDALSLRLLPAVQKPAATLMEVTADYGHHCCEQTAAKMLAAVLMYLSASDPVTARKAEEIIIAGAARERSMFTRKRGFRMYPDSCYFSQHYSKLAVRYLWKLSGLSKVKGLSRALRAAVEDGLAMADLAARHHGLRRVPQAIESIEDAFEAARAGVQTDAVRRFVKGAVDLSGPVPRPSQPKHAVHDRCVLAYAAAALFILRDREPAVRCANAVLAHLDDKGALYSTADSVACLSMFVELQRCGMLGEVIDIDVNGLSMTSQEALALDDQIESISVRAGCAIVEVTKLLEQDWDAVSNSLEADVKLLRDGTHFSVPRTGDRLELSVALTDGYRVGDLVHVALSPSLDWIEGGARVKRFSLDFAGRDELRVPVVVTGSVEDGERLGVCIRNMFEEERIHSPGLVAIDG